ncbi:MAG: hypothetical protein HRT73_07730 [Flavobacteriales bacterium]|nr:hypothetical protein [Flavobacteriales bacterium]
MIDPSLLTKSAISDKDLKIIKEQIDVDFDKMETGEKIAINLGTDNAHYLPSIAVVFNFLGFKYSISTAIEKLENIGVKPLEISRTSRYDLQNGGVGKRTYKKYIDWMMNAPIPYLDKLIKGRNPQLDNLTKFSSNAYHWLTFFNSIKYPIKHGNDELRPEYIPLIDFIEYRCNTEVALQQHIRNRNDYSDSERDNSDIWWKQFVKPSFAKHTVLTLNELDSMDDIMENGSITHDLTEVEKHFLYKNMLRLKFDFILTAIAHYEVGCVIAFCPDKQQLQTLAPLACQAIKKYASSDEYRTCFYWALETFKGWLSEVEQDVSWKEIASFIPISPESKETEKGVTDEEKKLDRLKSWRKGKNLPSNKLLEQFVTNFTESTGIESERDSLFILFRITIGLDKTLANLVKEWSKDIGSESQLNAIWKDVLSHYYEDYYLHYLDQHVARKTQIEKI